MKININNLLILSKSVTFKNTLLTIISVGINGLLGAAFFILVARFLGPEDFGLFSVVIATTALIADIADFGTNTGIVRFVPYYLKIKSDDAYRLLKLSLEIKGLIWLTILILGLFSAPTISKIVFNKPELTFPLQMGLLGVGGAMFFSFTQSTLQAFEKYKYWSAINITANFFRLVIVIVLIFSNFADLNSSLFIYLVLPFFGFMIGLYFLPIKNILASNKETRMFKNLRAFNFSVGIFTVIAAVSGRLDTYIAARVLKIEEVGIYGAAVQLNSFILQIIGAIGVVVAPKIASFDTFGKMLSYFKKLQLMVCLLAFGLLLGSPLALIFIPWFYGDSYQALPLIFLIYFFGMLIYLMSVPIHTVIFYYYSRPQFFIYTAIGHLLLVFFVGNYLAINYGLIGLTIAVCLGMVFNLVVPFLYVINRIRKSKNNG